MGYLLKAKAFMVTTCWGPSESNRPGSCAGLPIRNFPAAIATICGHSGHSWKLRSGAWTLRSGAACPPKRTVATRIAAMRNFIPPSNHVSSGMNILVACDSFKDALPADAVCRAIAMGLKKSHPGAVITQMPLSDGGEGLLDVLRSPLGLEWIET